ncbi:MAG: bifunctional DNA-binding transcriptional regulator/O6-methylguanine-DNA methyltransferase Ada [Thermodesulfobacteriota bacterium]
MNREQVSFTSIEAMNQESWWQAILARDNRFDGAFVFAVRSTGIYCRPSCPARRPRREQVLLFRLPKIAEQAGFRPCRRCRPNEAAIHDPRVKLVQRVCRYIEENDSLESAPTLADLSAHVQISPYYLQRTFKRIMGITPHQYAEACRLGRLKTLLKKGKDVTRALYEAGYGSSSRLYERAPAQLGMSPATYRRGGRGMRIGYTIIDCPLGRLLVAATEKGICAVSLSDSDSALEVALSDEYPAAEIRREESGLSKWMSAILKYLSGNQPHLNLPLDLQVTAFQWRVYKELCAIPYGSTRSYGEIAQALGHPKAARAVGRACATNPVSLVIPCHRAVQKDGSLGGYHWGIERKAKLLEIECKENRSLRPLQRSKRR